MKAWYEYTTIEPRVVNRAACGSAEHDVGNRSDDGRFQQQRQQQPAAGADGEDGTGSAEPSQRDPAERALL